jgi:hypothetical protein
VARTSCPIRSRLSSVSSMQTIRVRRIAEEDVWQLG